VCAEFDADNSPRDSLGAGLGRVTEYQAECKVRRTLHQEGRWNAVADLPTYKAGALLTLSELIKAGGSALVKLLLKLVNWVWELRPYPQRGRKVIVNLFKAGDTQLPGNYRGSP
jgi:hypothetical protein